MPPPRVSRLHKAALTFLVAASAAFFVGAQASAIEIASMTPSSTDAIEGDSSHHITIETDVGYAYVQWYVAGKLVRTNIGNGLGTTDYLSGYDYDCLGSTTGNEVTVEAIAYRNPGNTDDHDSDTVTITVWDPIRIRSFGNQDNCAEGEIFQVWASTNIPFTRVEYTIGGQSKVHNGDGSSTRSVVDHYFVGGDGSEEGEVYTVTAVAYATVAGKEVSSEEATSSIAVHGGKGKILKGVWAYVSYFNMDKVLEALTLYSSHGIRYYNDTENEGSIYATHSLYEKDPEDDNIPEREVSDTERISWTLALAWSDYVSYVTVENGTDFDRDMDPYEPVTMGSLVEGYVYYASVSSGILWKNTWANSDDDSVNWSDYEQTDEREYPDQWDDGYNSSTYNP